MTMAKTICRIQHTIKNRCRKKWRQRWKSLVQVNEHCCVLYNYGKLKNKIDVRHVSNKKGYLK